jgi:hypothetical protein
MIKKKVPPRPNTERTGCNKEIDDSLADKGRCLAGRNRNGPPHGSSKCQPNVSGAES